MKTIGCYDFISSRIEDQPFEPNSTYTVSIFKWVKASNTVGMKKGVTIFRFRGLNENARAEERAMFACQQLNNGANIEQIFHGKKSSFVK